MALGKLKAKGRKEPTGSHQPKQKLSISREMFPEIKAANCLSIALMGQFGQETLMAETPSLPKDNRYRLP